MESRDYPVEELLEDAKKFVQKESEKHPFGMKGAMFLMAHTEDRYLAAESKDDVPYFIFNCGLAIEEKIALCDKARTAFIKEMMEALIEKK